jgi:hypothetical protein
VLLRRSGVRFGGTPRRLRQLSIMGLAPAAPGRHVAHNKYTPTLPIEYCIRLELPLPVVCAEQPGYKVCGTNADGRVRATAFRTLHEHYVPAQHNFCAQSCREGYKTLSKQVAAWVTPHTQLTHADGQRCKSRSFCVALRRSFLWGTGGGSGATCVVVYSRN